MRIAYAASASYFASLKAIGARYDQGTVLCERFAAMGASVEVVDWRDPAADWGRFDVVLPTACWGYYEHAPEFIAWLDHLAERRVRLINDADLVRWNLAKQYLLDLAAAGIPVAPLLHFPSGSRPDLDAAIAAEGWSEVVLKPSISAGAWKTLRTRAPLDDAARAHAAELLSASGLIVQPFFEEVVSEGEWSLIYFGGELSHAVLKKPRSGDFRSQPTWGATPSPVDPPAEMRAQAEAVLRAAPVRPAYARVDGIRRNGELQLMELEVIEPYLFLDGADPEAPARFCSAVLAAARDA